MNAKTLKLYDTLIKYQLNDFSMKTNAAADFAKEMLLLSFEHGVEAVEFLSLRAPKIFEYETVRKTVVDGFLQKLHQKNPTKTLRLLSSDNVVIGIFYGLSNNPFTGLMQEVMLSSLVQNKLAVAEKLLRAAFKNPYAQQGEGMIALFDELLKALAQKQGIDGIPRLPVKTAQLLTSYAEKLKAPEKALLVQRIKEIT